MLKKQKNILTIKDNKVSTYLLILYKLKNKSFLQDREEMYTGYSATGVKTLKG
jgi:hypothetical protein